MTKKRLFALGTAALGVTALVVVVMMPSGEAEARPFPEPLCGFSAIWTCTLPDGTEKKVPGTKCDIRKFEERTGATCKLGG